MKKSSILLITLFIFLFSPITEAQVFYKWVNERGVINFTDNLDNVPKEYIEVIEVKEFRSPRIGVVLGYPPSPVSPVEIPTEERPALNIKELHSFRIRDRISTLENRLRLEKGKRVELLRAGRLYSPDERSHFQIERVDRKIAGLEAEIRDLRSRLRSLR